MHETEEWRWRLIPATVRLIIGHGGPQCASCIAAYPLAVHESCAEVGITLESMPWLWSA